MPAGGLLVVLPWEWEEESDVSLLALMATDPKVGRGCTAPIQPPKVRPQPVRVILGAERTANCNPYPSPNPLMLPKAFHSLNIYVSIIVSVEKRLVLVWEW